MTQSEPKSNTCYAGVKRGNWKQVPTSRDWFWFCFYRLGKWREFSCPITERSKAKLALVKRRMIVDDS